MKLRSIANFLASFFFVCLYFAIATLLYKDRYPNGNGYLTACKGLLIILVKQT
jgi:hypothetical protein